MGNNSMEMTKDDAGCDWVRARLPLWVGDRDIRADGNGEGGDLSLLEDQRIKRHLDRCATCRSHQFDLELVLKTLAAAAADLPVEPQAPSLWPALERRIQDLHRPAQSPWIGLTRLITEQWARGLADFATVQPMRRAWARDSLRAIFNGRCEPLGSGQKTELGWKLGFVAFLLIAVIAVPGFWREWSSAQSTIAANALPLADRGVEPQERATETQPGPTRSDDSEIQDEVVQADVARPVEPPGGAVTGSAEPKLATPARFGYDLEHGIPMPPDARESKPVY